MKIAIGVNSQECQDLSTIIDTGYMNAQSFSTWWLFYHEIWSEQYFLAWHTCARTNIIPVGRKCSFGVIRYILKKTLVILPLVLNIINDVKLHKNYVTCKRGMKPEKLTKISNKGLNNSPNPRHIWFWMFIVFLFYIKYGM